MQKWPGDDNLERRKLLRYEHIWLNILPKRRENANEKRAHQAQEEPERKPMRCNDPIEKQRELAMAEATDYLLAKD